MHVYDSENLHQLDKFKIVRIKPQIQKLNLASNLAYSDIKSKQNDVTCKSASSLPALEGLTAFVPLLQQAPID